MDTSIDNFLTHHARGSKEKREALAELLQRASTDKRARKICKAMICAKLKKTEKGRQLLMGRQLYKQQGERNSNNKNNNTKKNSVDKYLQHREARRLAAATAKFNTVFSLGPEELTTKLKSDSHYADVNKAIKKEKSSPKAIGTLLTRMCAEEEEEEDPSSLSSSSSTIEEHGTTKLPLTMKEAFAAMDENSRKLSQISLSSVPIASKKIEPR
mmetsp:Transcript_12171/g.17848  ORF Transcript_12171/g.17848 Transcript_12171/m.17848 type:complete len:213 (-) Transcript_12171:103-741(-)